MEEARPKPPGQNMSLWEHLAELRLRLIKSLIAMAVGAALAWSGAETILAFLVRPATQLLPPGQAVIFTGLQDGFLTSLKISLWTGFFLSAPFWLYQLWAFVAPALYPAERRGVKGLTVLSAGLMAGGAAFAYYAVFPLVFGFFLSFAGELLSPMPAVDRYLGLAMSLVLAFALAFQLPLIMMFLASIGLIDEAFLRRHRCYAVIAIFIAAAVLTPPDVASQMVLAGALMILYELSIFLIRRTKSDTCE